MSLQLVAHPETGLPVKQEVNYIPVERGELEADLAAKQADFDTAQANLEAAQAAHTTAQAALEDSKSNVSSYDAIAPATPADAPAEGSGSEDTTESEAQEVPVSVETDQPEF